jgi:hypothetical protein
VTAIEEARREEERRLGQQASVVARFYKKAERMAPFDPGYWVTLKNNGAAPASEVRLSFRDPDRHLRTRRFVDPDAMPVPWLHPGQDVSIELDVIPGAPPPADVVIGWTDGEGPQERQVRATWL